MKKPDLQNFLVVLWFLHLKDLDYHWIIRSKMQRAMCIFFLYCLCLVTFGNISTGEKIRIDIKCKETTIK